MWLVLPDFPPLVLEKPSGTSGIGFLYRRAVLPVTQPTVLIG